MSIKTFFSTTCETRELHTIPQLRSNYYRNKLNDVVNALKDMAKAEKLDVRNYDEAHKEMYLVGNGFDVIVTITVITPIECSVDFKVNYFSFIGLNRPIKKVTSFYNYLKQKLNFKGVSLHP